MNKLPSRLRTTMTLDNSKEFAEHDRVKDKLSINVYFARPYYSWERGTNENTNGLLRQYVPNGQAIRDESDHQLRQYVDAINNRPRKRLGYRTPAEVFDPGKLCCN